MHAAPIDHPGTHPPAQDLGRPDGWDSEGLNNANAHFDRPPAQQQRGRNSHDASFARPNPMRISPLPAGTTVISLAPEMRTR